MPPNQARKVANSEPFALYWNIGRVINENSAWGNKFVENLVHDIKLDFPDAKGYSVRNLKYIAKFSYGMLNATANQDGL